jgi:fumigaclavine B O-acetyltransferase
MSTRLKLSKPLAAVPVLESGVSRLIQALPFLSGEFTAVPASDGRKEILLVRPAPAFELNRILKIKYHGTSLHHVCKQMDTPSSYGGDLPHEPYMPYPRLPDPSRPQPITGFQVNVHTDGIILSVATHHCSFDATGMGQLSKTSQPAATVLRATSLT